MTSLAIHHDEEEFNLIDYDIEKLHRLAETGGVLYWNLRGAWGKVPNAVLSDALRLYTQTRALMGRRSWVQEQRGWIIRWEQTVPARSLQTASQAELLPQNHS